jgi:ribonucleoside-diphosphate reductase alpha chain
MGFEQEISEYIWNTKYRYRLHEKNIDLTLEDTWLRVAKAISLGENRFARKTWSKRFFDIMSEGYFLPGGRIIAGAGTLHDVTLFNCFVMGKIEDSLDGIFKALHEGAMTLQQGGGVGYDFSSLRPKGLIAERTGNIASGPVVFMRIWDAMSSAMQSTGARRGAMMGTLRCDHPDILEFIEAKADSHELRQFNVSVLITDEFMRALRSNDYWSLVFPLETIEAQSRKSEIIMRRWSGSSEKVPCRVFSKIKARKLWEKIIRSAYSYAEPGVIFEDTVNNNNNLWYREWQSATNPCGEIPLPYYGACNLGSLNLTRFIRNPFSKQASFDWEKLEEVASIATRFLDNVIEVSRYPLPAQEAEAKETRRIGLGFTGLGDALVMLNVLYSSNEALRISRKIMRGIYHSSWKTSIDLAKEKSPFPAYTKKYYAQGRLIQRLPEHLRNALKRHGVRNSHHTAIAPTGTISILSNNVSNGIEPIFEAAYHRHVRTHTGEILDFLVEDFAYHLWKSKGHSGLPPAWIDAQHLLPMHHLNIQAALQPYVDNAISKTIYIPENFPFSKLKAIYEKAYELRLKGCTIFRPNPVTGSVLTTQSVEGEGGACCSFDERVIKKGSDK